MRLATLLCILAAAPLPMLLGACANAGISRNVYEGVRAHLESLRATPREQSRTPLPSFEEYDRERRSLSAPRGG